MSRHLHTAFCEHYPPGKVRWWLHQPQGEGYRGYRVLGHLAVLGHMLGGRSAEETEALSHCFKRVVHDGLRDPIHGWPCVCLREEPPSAGEARGHVGGDGMSSIIAIFEDLRRAAEALPVPWLATRRIYATLGLSETYFARLNLVTQGQLVREVDREPESCLPDEATGRVRHNCYYQASVRMAIALGWTPRVVTAEQLVEKAA